MDPNPAFNMNADLGFHFDTCNPDLIFSDPAFFLRIRILIKLMQIRNNRISLHCDRPQLKAFHFDADPS
jgi:hypothetical protein